MTDLYYRIEDLCHINSITITKMCRDISLSRSVLSEFKAGRTKQLSERNVKLIADYFGVTPEYLLVREELPYFMKSDFSATDIEIIKLLPSLSDDDKLILYDTIRELYEKKFITT